MTETDFIERVECNFPYDNFDLASEIISQAGDVSQNAVYLVLHEILRAPPTIKPQAKELFLQMWQTDYEDDPIFRFIHRCIPAYMKQELVSVDIVVKLIEQMATHTGQIYALSLLYFACDDVTGEAKAAYHTVLSLWEMR
jgi:phosphate uptake regulator